MSEDFNQALARLQGLMTTVDQKQPRFRGCLYGPSGSGKTVLAQKIMKAIVPANRGILYVDTSEGWVSLKNHEAEGLTTNTQYIPFTTIEDIRIIGSAIKNKIGIYKYISGVILDEGSSMATIDTDRLFEARRMAHPDKVDSLVPEWPDYNAALQRFRQMNAELFDIEGLHVIILAHVADKKDNRGNIINMYPAFSPKIAAKVKEPLHLVGHCTAVYEPTGEGAVAYHREVQVHPTNLIDAKCRLDINQLRVMSDSLPSLVKAWLEKGGTEVKHDDIPRPDPQPEKDLKGLTTEEALSVVDEATEGGLTATPDTTADEFSVFEPIE